MSGHEEPWGIVATDTLHLITPGAGMGPACGSDSVKRSIDRVRATWRDENGQYVPDARPVFGPAGDRRVCLHCLASLARTAAYIEDELVRAREHNDRVARGLG